MKRVQPLAAGAWRWWPGAALVALCAWPAAAAWVAVQVLQALGTPLHQQGLLLSHTDGFVAEVHWICTAAVLVLPLLAMRAVVGDAMSLPWVLGALVFAWVVNELRLVVVLWLGVHRPEQFAWVHEVLAPLAMLVIGAAFVFFTRSPRVAGRALPCPL